jgi:hypothetical protein
MSDNLTILQRIKYGLLVIFIGFPLAAMLDALSWIAGKKIERRIAKIEQRARK